MSNCILKWSRFNFLYESKKHGKLLYNSYSNTFIRVDSSLYDELYRIKIEGSYDQSKNIFSEDELIFFKKVYFLVEDDDLLVEQLHLLSLERIFSREAFGVNNSSYSKLQF